MFCLNFPQDPVPNTPDLPVEGTACKAAGAGEGAEQRAVALRKIWKIWKIWMNLQNLQNLEGFSSSLILSDLLMKNMKTPS